MAKNNHVHADLRGNAEGHLEETILRVGKLPVQDVGSLVHELQVHQIELEMQNQQLRETQAELIQSRDRYADLYDAAPVGYLALDQQGKILEANLTASVFLGVERTALIGDWIQQFIVPEDADLLYLLCQKLARPGDRRTCELRIASRDGTILHVHLQCILMELRDGDERSFRVALIDMTALNDAENKRRELEQKLEQSHRLESLGVLAGGVAHDFNNMLFVIVAHADLLAEKLNRASPLQRHVEQIQTAATRSSELCSQMLAYSGKGNFEKRIFDLSEVVGEMSELMKSVAARTIAFEYRLSDDLPGIEGDMTSIRQIVMNLIVNASEAIGTDNGRVTLTTGLISASREYLSGTWLDDGLEAGDYVYLNVADTGCGMDEETKTEIFDSFFTTKFPGRGLGLAAVLGIIRSHAGAVDVQSQHGHGTTIRVLFPVPDHIAPRKEDTPVTREIRHRMATILIVDDEEIVRDSMHAVLEEGDYSVLAAADGAEAVELFRCYTDEVALVLMDITMPGLSAAVTCEMLEELAPDLPILLMSGFSQEDAVSRFTNRNIVGFLQKPCRDILTEIQGYLQPEWPRHSEPPPCH